MGQNTTKKRLSKKTIKRLILLLLVILFGAFTHWQNNDIVITEHDYYNNKVPSSFEGFKILQISDYHNKYCGENQEYILRLIEEESPDIIVITGDIIDMNRSGYDNSLELLGGVADIAPTYYVTGNHERGTDEYEFVREKILEEDIFLLEDKVVEVEKNGETISIIGLDSDSIQSNVLEQLVSQTDESDLRVLLAHNPEEITYYSECGADIAFCGHAHGGQIRLPFTQGLYAPDQGLLPKYTAGAHEYGDLTEYISRGIGNSGFPWRIFNRPEIVCVTLHHE